MRNPFLSAENKVIPLKPEEKELSQDKPGPWKHPQSWVPSELSFYLFLAPFFFWPLIVAVLVIQFFSQDLTAIDLRDLKSLNLPSITFIYAGDGKTVIGERYEHFRIIESLDNIPDVVRKAFIAAEDNAFYSHQGIDLFSIARAASANFKAGETSQGASTITQQTIASIFFPEKERTYTRKLKEAILSWQVERILTKDEILNLYLNIIFMGRKNSYGVEGASQAYFGKSVKDVNLAEAAMLAGAVPAPNSIAPHNHTKESLDRQRLVLDRMLQNGYVTEKEARDALNFPISYLPYKPNRYFEVNPLFTEEVVRWGVDKFGLKSFENDGLRIYSTLDVKAQEMAKKAVRNGLMALAERQGKRMGPVLRNFSPAEARTFREHSIASLRNRPLLPDHEPAAIVTEVIPGGDAPGVKVDIGDEKGFIPLENLKSNNITAKNLNSSIKVNDQIMVRVLYKDHTRDIHDHTDGIWILEPTLPPEIQVALVLIENSTGKVLAMYGGRDFCIKDVGKSDFNRVVKAKRQPGSSFKPFVYTAAIDNGYTEASVVYDVPVTYPDGTGGLYQPKNYSSKPSGAGMTINEAIQKSVNIIAVKVIKVLGPEIVVDYAHRMGIDSKLDPFLSLALGAQEVSLLELTKAYTTFPNKGSYVEPIFVSRVENREGKVIYEATPTHREAISPQTAYIMTDMLTGVARIGTASRVGAALNVPVGGKTGTSNDNADVWFVGFTPEYTCGVWVGRDSTRTALGYNEQGGRAAAPIFIDFMKAFLEDKETGVFEAPPGVVRIGSNVFKTGETGAGRVDYDMGDYYTPPEGPQDMSAASQESVDGYLMF
jgi:penicillin-binding protein 1A